MKPFVQRPCLYRSPPPLGFYRVCRSRWARSSLIVIATGEKEEIRSRLLRDARFVLLARHAVIRAPRLRSIRISSLELHHVWCFWCVASAPKNAAANQRHRCEHRVIAAAANGSERRCSSSVKTPFGSQLVTWYSFYQSGRGSVCRSVFLGWTRRAQFMNRASLMWLRG